MKFEFNRPKNQRIETDDLIKDLMCVKNKLNKTPTIEEYNNNGKFEATVFCRRFGSWNNALLKAGLIPNNKEWTEAEMFKNLEEVWTKLGKQPTRRDMDLEYSKISSGAYLRHFKTWVNALQSFVVYINDIDKELIAKQTVASVHKTPRDINDRLKFKVLQRDNFKCCACGLSPANTPGVVLHVDHIIPYSKGGETVIENLQTLCQHCNWGKGDMILK